MRLVRVGLCGAGALGAKNIAFGFSQGAAVALSEEYPDSVKEEVIPASSQGQAGTSSQVDLFQIAVAQRPTVRERWSAASNRLSYTERNRATLVYIITMPLSIRFDYISFSFSR